MTDSTVPFSALYGRIFENNRYDRNVQLFPTNQPKNKQMPSQSSRGDFLSPLTPPYMPFGIRRFNITSKHDAHLRFAFPAVRYSMGHTFDYTVTLFSPSATPISGLYLLWLLLTSHSSLLLRYFPACETSRDKPANLSSSTCLIYTHGLRLPFGLHCLAPAYPPCVPYIRFLFVRLRFRYPFFSLAPHDVDLGSRYGVRRQLRPLWTFTTD